jgi:hypothetical protein
MLSGSPGDTSTELVFAGGSSPPQAVASFEHLPEAVVRGAVLPGSQTVVVVADTLPVRERSWASSLIVLESGRPARVLAEGVYHASSPHVTHAGRVFVQRGKAGPQPPADLRVDDLMVDEVELASGATRTIHAWQGYETHIAGSLDDELFVYRVGPQGADLIAVQIDTGKVRTVVASWPGMARDFSVDPAGRTLVAQQLDAGPPRRWVVERIEVSSGTRTVLASNVHRDLVPFVWPGGGVLIHPERGRGPEVLGTTLALKSPAGATLWLRSTSADGAWLAGLWMRPSALPVAVEVRASDGALVPIPQREGHRVEVVGFVGGGA